MIDETPVSPEMQIRIDNLSLDIQDIIDSYHIEVPSHHILGVLASFLIGTLLTQMSKEDILLELKGIIDFIANKKIELDNQAKH